MKRQLCALILNKAPTRRVCTNGSMSPLIYKGVHCIQYACQWIGTRGLHVLAAARGPGIIEYQVLDRGSSCCF